jgi:hypothetical protein
MMTDLDHPKKFLKFRFDALEVMNAENIFLASNAQNSVRQDWGFGLPGLTDTSCSHGGFGDGNQF